MGLISSCTVTLESCTISGCTASTEGGGDAYGGALAVFSSLAELNASNVVNCSAVSLGGNGGTASAGGLHLECERKAGEQCHLWLFISIVSNCASASASGDARGGGLNVVDGARPREGPSYFRCRLRPRPSSP